MYICFSGKKKKEEMIKRALYITMFFLLQLFPSNKKKRNDIMSLSLCGRENVHANMRPCLYDSADV